MAGRFRTWLRRKLKLIGKTQNRETAFGGSNPQAAAPSARTDSPPPPYAASDLLPTTIHQLPRSIDGTESIEVLRARNPAIRPPSEHSHILRPPRHTTRPIAAARLAASAAVIGLVRALDEPNPKMVAARTAQAIAVAVSTTRSYNAFVAAVTATEACALLMVEGDRDNSPHDCRVVCAKNAIYTAAHTPAAMAADAGMTPVGSWPFNIHNTHSPGFTSQSAPLSAD